MDEFLDFVAGCVWDSPHQCDDETMAWFQENWPKVRQAANQDAQARSILQEWVDQQGHNRCWYYPDLFRRLCDLYGIKPTVEPHLPPEEEFKAGCDKYRGEEYSKPS
jgi:hypothetical protein